MNELSQHGWMRAMVSPAKISWVKGASGKTYIYFRKAIGGWYMETNSKINVYELEACVHALKELNKKEG